MCAVASEPFVPTAAATLRTAFPTVDWDTLRLEIGLPDRHLLAPGDTIVSPGLLFTKLSPEQLEESEHRFGGADSDETAASGTAGGRVMARPGSASAWGNRACSSHCSPSSSR